MYIAFPPALFGLYIRTRKMLLATGSQIEKKRKMLQQLLRNRMVIYIVRTYFRNVKEIMRKSGDVSMQETKGMIEGKSVYHEHREKESN